MFCRVWDSRVVTPASAMMEQRGQVVGNLDSSLMAWVLDASCTTWQPCDLRQVTELLCASVSSLVTEGMIAITSQGTVGVK